MAWPKSESRKNISTCLRSSGFAPYLSIGDGPHDAQMAVLLHVRKSSSHAPLKVLFDSTADEAINPSNRIKSQPMIAFFRPGESNFAVTMLLRWYVRIC